MLYKVTENYKSTHACGRYEQEYKIGEIITAIPETIGFMLFDNIDDAERFLIGNVPINRGIILEVEPMDIIMKPQNVSLWITEKYLDIFYNEDNRSCLVTVVNTNATYLFIIEPPKGTVCCHKIKVLREIKRLNYDGISFES